jgi:uncharacterized protein YabN with tetrapyrrole methylase and pyrophosphatase domain
LVAAPRHSLVVVGTGIRTTGQLTIETIAWLRRADEVVHLVADPVAEAVVASIAAGREQSLRRFYAEGEPRRASYDAMVDCIIDRLHAVRVLCVAFYGHPGVFACVGHEAIARARAEGIEAQMLPGISAEDCLFADLGVDPAVAGCLSYEATDFLVRRRVFDAAAHLVLWQIGVLGELRYRQRGFDRWAIPLLVDKLAEQYPLDHEATIYQASTLPLRPPRVTRVRLDELVDATLTAGSTLYVPPARAPERDEERAALVMEHLNLRP